MTTARAPRIANPFTRQAVLWMLAVGCVSALLFLVLTAYAPQLRSEENGAAHALSKSAIGYAGLVELLRDEGVPVLLSRDPHPGRATKSRLLVLTPDLETAPTAIAKLGGADVELIILPKWIAAPDPRHPGWVMRMQGATETTLAQRVLNGFDRTDHLEQRKGLADATVTTTGGFFNSGARMPAGRFDSLQTIVGPDKDWVSVAETEPGHAILIRKSDAAVFILSDPDLLNNQGLAQLANARGASLLIGALRGGNLPVAFDLTLAGFTRTRSILGVAFEPPFLAATLCAIAAAALMGLHAAARFGPAIRSAPGFALGKRALADNSAALVRLARRQYRMGAGYAALTRGLAARAVGAPRDQSDDQMDELLDRLGRIRQAKAAFSELERRARDARDTPALMAAAHDLYQWRLEMTHERR